MRCLTLSGSKISFWSQALTSGSVIVWSSNSVISGPAGPGSAAATWRGYRPFLYKRAKVMGATEMWKTHKVFF